MRQPMPAADECQGRAVSSRQSVVVQAPVACRVSAVVRAPVAFRLARADWRRATAWQDGRTAVSSIIRSAAFDRICRIAARLCRPGHPEYTIRGDLSHAGGAATTPSSCACEAPVLRHERSSPISLTSVRHEERPFLRQGDKGGSRRSPTADVERCTECPGQRKLLGRAEASLCHPERSEGSLFVASMRGITGEMLRSSP
jgi:hypothetical protein